MKPTSGLPLVEIREAKKRTYWDYELQMSVLKCRSCGALALALEDERGGQRITGHKCSGAWETLQTFKDVKFDLADLDIYNKIGKPEAL